MHTQTTDLADLAFRAMEAADRCEAEYRTQYGLAADAIICDDTLDKMRAEAFRLSRTLTDAGALTAAAHEAVAAADHYEAGYRLAHGFDDDEVVEDATLDRMRAEASVFTNALAAHA